MKPIIESWKGLRPKIADDAFIAPGAVLIGDIEIGPKASVWYGCVLRADDHAIRIGARSNIQDGSVIHVTLKDHPTLIGEDVIVGHGARLHGCTLADSCLIGIGAIVLDGAEVGSYGFVAAGAVVTPNRKVPGGELWGGNPARKIRDVTAQDRAFIDWDAKHYVTMAEAYAAKAAAK